MSSKPQIFVFHLKEVIYTAIFILLGLLFLLLLFIMFKPDSDKKEENGGVSSNNTNATVSYVPGTYSTTVNLNGQSFEVQVTTAEDQITDISLVSVDSSVSTLYPLLEPTMASLSEQIRLLPWLLLMQQHPRTPARTPLKEGILAVTLKKKMLQTKTQRYLLPKVPL